MQIVESELDPGEGARAEVSAMMFVEDSIEMETAASNGLVERKLKRRLIKGGDKGEGGNISPSPRSSPTRGEET